MGKNIMKKINQYKIIEPIWSSSDSTIYEAIHEITQMQIALKIFTNIELISKVKQKIKHGIIPTNYMTLDHKSINRCIDLIIDEDIIALTSEYLIGKNLDELINEKGRLSNVDFTDQKNINLTTDITLLYLLVGLRFNGIRSDSESELVSDTETLETEISSESVSESDSESV